MEKLTKIANKCGTDKGTEHFEKHGYTEEYGKYIPDMGQYTLIEIGAYHCESLRMWEEYNPDMNIYGVDIEPSTVRYVKSEDDYALFIGDATKQEFVEKLLSFMTKNPDFIIDDGSHRYEDILATFKLLYPELKSGGYYFIEDLHAGQARRNDVITDIEDMLNDVFKPEMKLVCNDKLFIIQKP
jgi:cephalosporin hydroxylase